MAQKRSQITQPPTRSCLATSTTSSWRAFTNTCGFVTCARNWRFAAQRAVGKVALDITRLRSGYYAASSWRDAVAKCLQARPVGTTPIVAWHEVPGKGAPESTHQQKGESPLRTGTLACP